MNINPLPARFLERLEQIVPAVLYPGVAARFDAPAPRVYRINTLRIGLEEARARLKDAGVVGEPVSAVREAVVLFEGDEAVPLVQDLLNTGCLYRQSVSSMLAVLALEPAPGERVLDVCAAPGSKTTYIAARMDHRGHLTAVETVRSRFYKLKYVIDLLGAENVVPICSDGRRFRPAEPYDRVLVDAPCSSEGRFRTADKKSLQYWSERKIAEMVVKQRGLLLTAGRAVRPGGVLVYSTCTFAPEENEGVIDWFLRKTGGAFQLEVIPWSDDVPRYPAVFEWRGRGFDPRVEECSRILPSGLFDGFFIARFRRMVDDG